jgi:hypothetical protein
MADARQRVNGSGITKEVVPQINVQRAAKKRALSLSANELQPAAGQVEQSPRS